MHEQGKHNAPRNAQKQQKNTTKNKARKQATKTTTLFVFSKMLQAAKKRRENCKHQQKMFSNEKRTRDKPQKSPKAPGRENSITRQVNVVPSKLPTGQQKIFVINLKKK